MMCALVNNTVKNYTLSLLLVVTINSTCMSNCVTINSIRYLLSP